MKRFILITISIFLVISSAVSCGKKYDPIDSTEDELRVVGYINGYAVYYDELCFAAYNNGLIFAENHSLSLNGGESWKPYREEFEKAVYDGIKYNYAIQILLKESGYTLDNAYIQAAVNEDVKGIIDQCGSRNKYKQYLEDMALTDRLLRFNIAVSYASNELLFLMNDRGAFDDKVDFDIELLADASPLPSNPFNDEFFKAMSQLMSGEIYIQAESILIPNNAENAESTAHSVLDKANSGESLTDIKNNYSVVTQHTPIADIFETDIYFESLKSISENTCTMVKTDEGYRILKRLPCNMNYIQQNCYTIAYAYVESLFKQSVRNYAATLTVELTDFGKALDLISLLH